MTEQQTSFVTHSYELLQLRRNDWKVTRLFSKGQALWSGFWNRL